MKFFQLTVPEQKRDTPFQVHRLGMHEVMEPAIVNRPKGTRDYLLMLFHTGVRIRTQAGESDFPPSSVMIWAPPDGHYYGNVERRWDHSWLHFSGTMIAALLKKNRVPLRTAIPMPDESVMEHFLLELAGELGSWHRPDPTILQNLFENFVRSLARSATQRARPGAPPRLVAVRSHMEQHFTRRLRLKELARQAGWSEPHFCLEFRRWFGLPAIQFIQRLRMNQAVYLLRDQNQRITEVAEATGYPDVYAFSKMFKRYRGMSPRAFRELNLKSPAQA